MKIKDIMNTNPVSLDKNASIYEVWKVIYKKHIHAIPIVDGRDRLLGIISISDILKKIYPNYDMHEWDVSKVDLEKMEENAEEISKLKAEDIMSKRVYALGEDATILAALSKMIIKQVHQLPITNEKNKLIGTIYKVDIFDSLFANYLKK